MKAVWRAGLGALGSVELIIRPMIETLEAGGLTARPALLRELFDRVATWSTERSCEDLSLTAWLDHVRTSGLQDEATVEAPIWLSTVHGVKGLEAPNVAVVGMHEDGFDEDPAEPEERRLWFVAATRARDRLLCTYSTGGGERRPGTFWREATTS